MAPASLGYLGFNISESPFDDSATATSGQAISPERDRFLTGWRLRLFRPWQPNPSLRLKVDLGPQFHKRMVRQLSPFERPHYLACLTGSRVERRNEFSFFHVPVANRDVINVLVRGVEFFRLSEKQKQATVQCGIVAFNVVPI
jgi:hypothetical protein